MADEPIDEVPGWLSDGEIVGIGRIPEGSNATFAVAINTPDGERLAVYKPKRGERPLWDFPNGCLFQREVATYLVSRELGWCLVPPTVTRDGPHGIGSVQLFCQPRDGRGPAFSKLLRRRRDEFLRLAVFDIVTNNADRKFEHCLIDESDHIWAIDNGLTFNTEFKTRTVLVDFSGERVPEGIIEELEELATDPRKRKRLDAALQPLIEPDELERLYERIDVVCKSGRLPRVMPHWELHYYTFE